VGRGLISRVWRNIITGMLFCKRADGPISGDGVTTAILW